MRALFVLAMAVMVAGCGEETGWTDISSVEYRRCDGCEADFAAARICVASEEVSGAPFTICDRYGLIEISDVTLGDGIPEAEYVCHIVAPGGYVVTPKKVDGTTEPPPVAELPDVQAWVEYDIVFHYVLSEEGG